MSRRKLRIILAVFSLILFTISILTFFAYAYFNAELYMAYHKNGVYIVDIYMAIYLGMCITMFIYAIFKLIFAIVINNDKYVKLIKKFNFGLIILYISFWIILIGGAGFISTVLFLPLSTTSFVVGIALMMVISLIFFIDIKSGIKIEKKNNELDVVQSIAPAPQPKGKASQDDLKDVYDRLLAQGLITEEEYKRRMNDRNL